MARSYRMPLSTSLLCLLSLPAARAQTDRPLDIRAAPDGPWNASLRDVGKVLDSAGGELWRHFPDRTLKPILVEPKGGPIVLYRRGPEGEYRVRLNTGNTYWAQYAFQFSHEFCHILCNYREGGRSNKWFEESLCELASLFVLRRMSETWKVDPPYPNWRGFSSALSDYAKNRLDEFPLPEGTTLAAWYREQAEELRKDPCQRPKNRVVAGVLLPLFEQHPEHWQAIEYLNVGPPSESDTFKQYLQHWHRHSPARHRPFVRQIAGEFGIALQADEEK